MADNHRGYSSVPNLNIETESLMENLVSENDKITKHLKFKNLSRACKS